MHCPFCSATDTKVIDSRLVAEGHLKCVAVENALNATNDSPPSKVPSW